MNIIKTELPGLLILEPKVFADSRGYFLESFNSRVFEQNNLQYQWLQDNESMSNYGVVRGLHYQLNPFAQAKLVRVIVGEVLDVVVDIRKGSPTFGKKIEVLLSAENKRQLLIPRGFAHGFSVLKDGTIFSYKCDNVYNKESESGINIFDETLNIDWRIPKEKAIVSEKDKMSPPFSEANNNFEF
jgi:dTDP-4-dehydrorhamnose 3,5-epimerase